MPCIDGYQLALIVQQSYPEIKIQLISGFTDEKEVQYTKRHFSKNLLRKPFRSKVLLHRVRNILDQENPLIAETAGEQTVS
jgi:DNA-binding response OmpR family regulator